MKILVLFMAIALISCVGETQEGGEDVCAEWKELPLECAVCVKERVKHKIKCVEWKTHEYVCTDSPHGYYCSFLGDPHAKLFLEGNKASPDVSFNYYYRGDSVAARVGDFESHIRSCKYRDASFVCAVALTGDRENTANPVVWSVEDVGGNYGEGSENGNGILVQDAALFLRKGDTKEKKVLSVGDRLFEGNGHIEMRPSDTWKGVVYEEQYRYVHPSGIKVEIKERKTGNELVNYVLDVYYYFPIVNEEKMHVDGVCSWTDRKTLADEAVGLFTDEFLPTFPWSENPATISSNMWSFFTDHEKEDAETICTVDLKEKCGDHYEVLSSADKNFCKWDALLWGVDAPGLMDMLTEYCEQDYNNDTS